MPPAATAVAAVADDQTPAHPVRWSRSDCTDGRSPGLRSEVRRVGKECVSTRRSRRSPSHSKNNQYTPITLLNSHTISTTLVSYHTSHTPSFPIFFSYLQHFI